MAHSAVTLNQFVILFGGLIGDNQLVSNDLYVLSLDGNLGGIAQAFEGTTFENESRSVGPVQIQISSNPVKATTSSSSTSLNRAESSCIQIPLVELPSTMQRQTSSSTTNQQSSVIAKPPKGSKQNLKVTNPEDRKIISGHVVNQIINYNNGLTHQIFLNGGPFSYPLSNTAGAAAVAPTSSGNQQD